MQVTFGIDVSKSTSTVCELIGESKNELTITNNRPGFIQLLHELTAFSKHPQIIFEATGVYSRTLQSFLEDYGYDYVILNPLKAKKEMDMGLRHNKTDKTDAYHLALIQRLYHHPINQLQSQTYKQLNALSRFYDQLTADLVMAKNRLHQALQSTFPEIENLFSSAKGKNYWQIVVRYPHCDLVRREDKKQLINWLMSLKGIAFKHALRTADKLIELAYQAYPVVSCSSIEVEQVQYYAHRLLNLSDQRENLIARMVKLAKSLPNYVRVLAELGDLRRFSNPNKINAFIGIDPGRYQSGEMDSNLSITKHGNAVARKLLYRAIGQIDNAAKTNPCHIADYYESKKLSSQTKGFKKIAIKKIAIASIHKLIRTIYALIINDQPYDYNVATHNQKDFSRN